MARIGTLAAIVAGPLALAACGGGGGGDDIAGTPLPPPPECATGECAPETTPEGKANAAIESVNGFIGDLSSPTATRREVEEADRLIGIALDAISELPENEREAARGRLDAAGDLLEAVRRRLGTAGEPRSDDGGASPGGRASPGTVAGDDGSRIPVPHSETPLEPGIGLTGPQVAANFAVREFGGTDSSVYERYGYWELKVGLFDLTPEMDISRPVGAIRLVEDNDLGFIFNLNDIGYEMSGHLPRTWPTGRGTAQWSGGAVGVSTGGDYYAGTDQSPNPLYSIEGDFDLEVDFDSYTYRASITELSRGYPDMVGEGYYIGLPLSRDEFHFSLFNLDEPGTTADNVDFDDRWSINGSFRGRDHTAIVGTFHRGFESDHPDFPNHALSGMFGAAYRQNCVGYCDTELYAGER